MGAKTLNPTLVLVHGWGFGAEELWAPLRRDLPEFPIHTVDLGFFGPEEPTLPAWPELGPVVAVGHSLGVLWLLHHQPGPWDALISLNGFPRFTAGPDYRPAVAPRVLERMLRRCRENAGEVVTAFRATCGAPASLPGIPQAERLCAGLSWLAEWDERDALATAGAVLALGGGRDPVLPAGMEGHFSLGTQSVHAEAGHLLPLQAPGWCAERIREFVKEETK